MHQNGFPRLDPVQPAQQILGGHRAHEGRHHRRIVEIGRRRIELLGGHNARVGIGPDIEQIGRPVAFLVIRDTLTHRSDSPDTLEAEHRRQWWLQEVAPLAHVGIRKMNRRCVLLEDHLAWPRMGQLVGLDLDGVRVTIFMDAGNAGLHGQVPVLS